jgi:hypothetical protein
MDTLLIFMKTSTASVQIQLHRAAKTKLMSLPQGEGFSPIP